MTPSSNDCSDRERRIDELVAAYLEDCERGNAPDPEVWIGAHQEFSEELREFLSDWTSGNERMRTQNLGYETSPILGEFRVIAELGRGGMGIVYEAEQISLRRRVAIKTMALRNGRLALQRMPGIKKTGVEELRQRFVQEAELAGGLQHPGIVPVYAAGMAADGEPFYAMRLIEGENLQDAINELHANKASQADRFTGLEFRRLLRRFIDVCNAIEYAHSRQVIHRDIKPRNIMLGCFGETLVVDWGLAKNRAMQEDSGATIGTQGLVSPHVSTATGARVGTPAFMSPEQAAGRGDVVGIGIDIYGLGATLYCLLTGRAPFAEDAEHDRHSRIERGEFVSPCAENAFIPKALEAICLRAMALRSEDRYATSRELGEDLERWLADEPVLAYEESLWSRLQRFLRRHQTMSTSVSAAVLATAISLAFGSWLLGRANERERAARGKADAHFRLAHRAVNEYFTKVADDNRLLQADLRPLRRDLLRSARTYYEQFVTERKEDPKLRADLGVALGRLGLLVLETEPKPNALPMYEQAIAVFEELTAAHPDVAAYWDELSADYNDLGMIYQEMGRLSDAEANLLAAVDIRERLVASEPDSSRDRSRLAMMYSNLGMLYRIIGRLDDSEQHHLRANAMWDTLLQSPENAKLGNLQSSAAQARYLLGNLYYTRGDLDQAEVCFRDSIQSYQQLSRSAPAFVHLYKELPGVVTNLARVYFDQLRYPEAEQLLRDALPLQEQFARDHPSLTQHQFDVGRVCTMLAQACRGTKNLQDAEFFSRRAIESLAVVVADNPDIVQYRSLYAGAFNDLGLTLDDLGRHDEARKTYEQGISQTEQLLDDSPDMLNERIDLAAMFANVGNSLHSSARDIESLEWYGRAERTMSDLESAAPRAFAEQMANIHLGRARTLSRLTRFAEAVEEADSGIQLDTLKERNALLTEVKAEALARWGHTDDAIEAVRQLQARLSLV